MMVNKRNFGITLVELVVVVAVMSILAGIAIPLYQNQVIKTRRAAAQAEMMQIANLQQQYLLANRSYATHVTLSSNGYTLPSDVGDYYSYTVTVTDAPPGFTITFTPSGSQSSDVTLTANNYGVKTPAEKW